DAREVGDLRHLLHARAARLGPEVQDHDLAAIALERHVVAARVLEREARGLLLVARVVGTEDARRRAAPSELALLRDGHEAVDADRSDDDEREVRDRRERDRGLALRVGLGALLPLLATGALLTRALLRGRGLRARL